jgi:outer membrane translocation and assembly module TamA
VPKHRFIPVLICILLSSTAWAVCPPKQDYRDNKNSGVLITNFVISGTQTLSSPELVEMEGRMTDSCFNEDPEELEERIRGLFQDRGYFTAEVKSVRVKPTDVLGIPKPATLEAEVREGVRYKLAQVKIVGNHAFNAESIRNQFPMKPGTTFERFKIAGGLETVRKLYGADGFIDFTAIPDAKASANGTILLTLTVEEGQQYHMGQLHVLGNKETAEKLIGGWELGEGAVFDLEYIGKFIDANRQSLPEGFNREDVQLVRDCPKASVDIRLVLVPVYAYQEPRPKDINCERPSSP